MIRTLKEFFERRIQPSSPSLAASERALQLATAALLFEVSRADHTVTDDERKAISDAVRRTFGLPDDDTAELLRLAEQEAAAAVSAYQFTSLIDKQFQPERKVRIVELLWQVAFADADKDRHEEHLIRRIADLLHVSHKDFIAAKLAAQRGAAPLS